MFNNRKILKKIQDENKNLEAKSKKIENQIKELKQLKTILENDYPSIDITNIYYFKKNDDRKKYIVKMECTEELLYNHVILTDIFNNNIVYENYLKLSPKRELDYFCTFKPIYEIELSLLAYANNKVPLYVLQQLYYNMNDVDLSSQYVLKQK